ncbi:hypothetical protein [Aureimonas psammosilenae]|uniref:hypothetical protein n=1 Tax=Aureimonas psammosilenae TaxID=2495496 RepID=UPI001260D5C1|nr:hypothetical protein [Aureimonas psammosilenae]
MPTLDIQGRSVTVDDSFLRLSPEDQNRTVDEIATSLGITGSQGGSTGAGQPQEPEGSGIALNATAGANSALYSTLGAPVDLARGALNLGVRGYNAATGSDVGLIPENSFGGSRYIAETLGGIDPVLDPRNTVAATTGERIARGAGEGAGYALAPEAAVAGLIKTGAASPRIAETAGRVFGRGESVGAVAGNAAVGAASGAGAQAAMEAAPDAYDPLAGMAGGLIGGGAATLAGAVPSLLRTGGRMVGDYLAPMSEAGRERMASERLRSGTSDINAARESLDNPGAELVPGSQPTTGQLTGDLGLLGMERGAAVKRPEPFAQRRADQNAARVGALEGVQTGGAPEKVADAVRAHLKQLDDNAQGIVDRAATEARGRANTLGMGQTPEASGATLREALEAARASARASESRLWDLVDPDGTLALPPSNIRKQGETTRKNLPFSAKPPTGEEAAILDTIGQYGDVVPFSEMTALSSRLKAAMREERSTNGETPAYARMSRLSNAIAKDLELGVKVRAGKDAEAVAAGQMSPEETIQANLARWVENWSAERSQEAVGFDGGSGNSIGSRSAAPGTAGLSGATSEAGGRLGRTPRDPRLPRDDLQPNFGQADLDKLNQAKAATIQRVETFDNGTLAPLRRRPTKTGPYDLSSSEVAGRIFAPGAKSYEAIGRYRQAVGDDAALPALRDYAVDRARKAAMREDGTFDPVRLETWRRGHSDALRAIPGLDNALADAERASGTLGTVIRERNRALADAQKGTVGSLLKLDNPEDVTRTVGSFFGSRDGINRMMQLRQRIGGDKEALQGLKQAVADHMRQRFIGNTEAGTSGIGTMKSDGFQEFVRRNVGALKIAGYTADEVTTLQALADDLQRSNRSVAAVKNPGDSNTAEKLYAANRENGPPSIMQRIVGNVPAAMGAAGGFTVGGATGAFLGAIGAKTAADMRAAGINTVDDIIADALLNPARAKLLLARPSTRRNEEQTLQMLGRMYQRAAATSAIVSVDGGPEPYEGISVDSRTQRQTGALR